MTDQDGGDTTRKFPHDYDGRGGNGHFDGKFISAEYSSSHGGESYSAGVSHTTLNGGSVTVLTHLEDQELDMGILTHLSADQARNMAQSLLEAANEIE